MNFRVATSILLLTAWLASGPALSSDWVNGDATMYREAKPRPVVVPPGPGKDQGNDGAISVTDPGQAGSPSDQSSPHALQGNVNQWRPGSQPQFTGRPMRPIPAPPETKVVAPKVFQMWLQQTHPELGAYTRNAAVVIKGQWDDSSHVLHSFGIPSVKLPASKLSPEALAGTKILIVDCAGQLQAGELRVVNDFVRNGGYLITTDWALDGCLTRGFPGYVMWNSGSTETKLVYAHEVDSDSTLLKNTVDSAYWKLDPKCQTVRILNSRAVQVLAISKQLMREDPDGQGILALTFQYGKGHVLHLVGHFDNNSDRASNNALSDPAPGIGISLRQALAGNFVAEAMNAHREENASPENTSVNAVH